jgi:hypothetical protein
MSLSPAVTDPYSTTGDGEPQPDSVPAVYAALIAGLLAVLAAHLAPTPGVPIPSWATRVLGRLPRFRTEVQRALTELTVRLGPMVERDLTDIVERAAREAAADARWDGPLPDVSPVTVRAVLAVLTSSHQRIQAVMEDAFRAGVRAGQTATGDPTRDIQRVLDDLADRGITGYTDAAGRNWSLEHYVETAVRAQYAEVALNAYLDVCRAAGVRFARISVNHTLHKACRDWEGKTVSLDGSPAGIYWVASPAGRMVEVRCAGTLPESRAAGVWHPWCQHRLTAVVPGGGRRSRPSPSVDRVARAQRRYLSRTARAWRRRQRVALTPKAREQAQANAERWDPRQQP